uniref:Uncharacterized protein n=1 Tax=Glossina palpalis gambiensis TaxID=67801 RepID=A0A1B0BJA0_9MUSC
MPGSEVTVAFLVVAVVAAFADVIVFKEVVLIVFIKQLFVAWTGAVAAFVAVNMLFVRRCKTYQNGLLEKSEHIFCRCCVTLIVHYFLIQTIPQSVCNSDTWRLCLNTWIFACMFSYQLQHHFTLQCFLSNCHESSTGRTSYFGIYFTFHDRGLVQTCLHFKHGLSMLFQYEKNSQGLSHERDKSTTSDKLHHMHINTDIKTKKKKKKKINKPALYVGEQKQKCKQTERRLTMCGSSL